MMSLYVYVFLSCATLSFRIAIRAVKGVVTTELLLREHLGSDLANQHQNPSNSRIITTRKLEKEFPGDLATDYSATLQCLHRRRIPTQSAPRSLSLDSSGVDD